MSLPLGRPFITACIGGGIGGAVVGAFGHVGAITIGPSGAALIPLIANHQWMAYVFGLLASYAGGFVATYFFGVPKSAMVATASDGTVIDETASQEEAPSPEQPTADQEAETATVQTGAINFVAPATGQLKDLSEVADDVFSQKMVGDGFAVEPTSGTIVAPVDGTIVSVMPSKHAWTMTTATGLEILVHMGLDTVELNGAPFSIDVNDQDTVKAGQPIATMDLAAIQAAGKGTTVMTIITNMDHVASLTAFTDQAVAAGDEVFTVTSK
ncbi:PTS system sucrose-specific transporter subunit IIABC [Lacticaseibacillus zeae DSM 20178 = KCTC 3804]|uniref:PTS system sucrose-specific transporter subunit IIABC n=1 Tax=Lacticaseibacillus zeae DSM 20178 = KCTC 3804 TaxID=1423816 RepID=A0A0R1F2U0_LACZE|nr:PTS system sucrose-specific transporter subunit IIABC [Lacticaseibacillus zeae DSM 20178 = KCTC 3804]